jgi:putative Holliday junction resolvase
MGRLLAIDYGKKRCGIAVSDLDQVFAFGHDTVLTSDLLDYLIDYTQKENVAGIVVGMPKRLHNQLSSIANDIHQFIVQCKSQFPSLKFYTYDERFTSKIASHEIARASSKKQIRQDKGLIDQVSATLLLQSFLSHQQTKIS